MPDSQGVAASRLVDSGLLESAQLAGLSDEETALLSATLYAVMPANPASAPSVTAAVSLGQQVLAVERVRLKSDPPDGQPSVLVFLHDHARALSRRLLVDMQPELGELQRVRENRLIDSVHLPLNGNEIAWAMDRVASHTELLAQLQDLQIAAGRLPFSSLNELQVKASVHEPIDASDACNRHRCALLALFDQSHTVLPLEPIVEFTSGSVRVLQH